MAGHYPYYLSFIFTRGENQSETGAPNASDAIQQIWLFNTLQIVAFLLHGTILFTVVLSSNVRRTSTWLALIAAWMVFTLSNLLLVGQQIGPNPGFGICLTQAGLIYATPVLTAFCSVAFILQLYLTVTHIFEFKAVQVDSKHTFFFIIAPPVSFVIIFVEVLVQGLLDPKVVQRDATGMYCHLTSNTATLISGFLVCCAMLTMLTFEALTAIMVYQNWATFRRRTKPVHSNGMVSLTMIIRSAIFGLTKQLTIVLSVVSVSIPSGSRSFSALHLMVASLPVAVALIFGTQADIVRVWMFWKKNVPATPVPVKEYKSWFDDM